MLVKDLTNNNSQWTLIIVPVFNQSNHSRHSTAWGTKSDICIKSRCSLSILLFHPVSTFLISLFLILHTSFSLLSFIVNSSLPLPALSTSLFTCPFIIYFYTSFTYHSSFSTYPRSSFDNDNLSLFLFVYHFPSIFSLFPYAHAHPFAPQFKLYYSIPHTTFPSSVGPLTSLGNNS